MEGRDVKIPVFSKLFLRSAECELKKGIEQMINTKQQELIHELLKAVNERFPEVKLRTSLLRKPR